MPGRLFTVFYPGSPATPTQMKRARHSEPCERMSALG